jgi:hypothetical protein
MQTIGRDTLEEVSSEDYMGFLKEGLTVVETIDRVLTSLILSNSTVRNRLVVLMQIYGVKCEDIEVTLKNLYRFIGEGAEKARVERMMSDNLVLLR